MEWDRIKFTDIIEWTLLSALLIFMIYAQIDGRFIHNEYHVMEVCEGIPTQETIWEYNLTFVGNDTITGKPQYALPGEHT